MITSRELKAQYYGSISEREKREEFLSYAIYRPLSFQVTPLFLRAGLSANQVTLIGLVLLVLMPVTAFLSPNHGYLSVGALDLAFKVLDCVDGNIARSVGSSTRLGQYLDSLSGKLHLVLLLLALAIIAANEVPLIEMDYWISLALLGGLVYMWGRESRGYFAAYLNPGAESLVGASSSAKNLLLSTPRALKPLFILILGSLDMAYLVLCGVVLMEASLFLIIQLRIFSRCLEADSKRAVSEPASTTPSDRGSVGLSRKSTIGDPAPEQRPAA
jgi:phosphatidylglycerophosphate synthase